MNRTQAFPKIPRSLAYRSAFRKLGAVRQIKIRVIPAKGCGKEYKQTFTAQRGSIYNPEGIETVLEQVAEWVDKTYPLWEFRIVEIGPGMFNFVYDGLREQLSYPPELKLSQSFCDTTQTERFTNPQCTCQTYEGNLGPCKTFETGANGRCPYCDHDRECHLSLLAQLAMTEFKSASEPDNGRM